MQTLSSRKNSHSNNWGKEPFEQKKRIIVKMSAPCEVPSLQPENLKMLYRSLSFFVIIIFIENCFHNLQFYSLKSGKFSLPIGKLSSQNVF